MKIYSKIPGFSKNNNILTIGNFDGVHLGHQAIFKRMRDLCSNKEEIIAITFDPFPEEFLYPEKPIQKLCTLDQKISSLKKERIDHLIILPFNEEIAKQSAKEFLGQIPFRHLILGHGAAFGKNREGNANTIKNFSQKQNFSVEYIERISYKEIPISSSRIRKEIERGSLDLAKELLGKNYSSSPSKSCGS